MFAYSVVNLLTLHVAQQHDRHAVLIFIEIWTIEAKTDSDAFLADVDTVCSCFDIQKEIHPQYDEPCR